MGPDRDGTVYPSVAAAVAADPEPGAGVEVAVASFPCAACSADEDSRLVQPKLHLRSTMALPWSRWTSCQTADLEGV